MANNRPWNLESFLDSLIIELDKARETLAVKAINKPLTYAVKDVSLEMQLFPSFDGENVQFVTAQPGETGASKIAIQLGSITDQQIRKTTKGPVTKDDLSIDLVAGIDDEVKQSLRKIGVNSVNDLAEIEKSNVDLEKVGDRKINYSNLAGLLQKARRGQMPPAVYNASFSHDSPTPVLVITGENLAIDQSFRPVAVFNGKLAEVKTASRSRLELQLPADAINRANNELVMAVDPFTVFKVNVNEPS
jgi:hypothetical protein